MIKKLKCVIWMFLLSATLLCINAYAQNGKVTVSTAKIKQGDTKFDITINVENNPGIIFAKFKVEFPNELSLTNVTDGGLWNSNNHSNNMTSPYTLYWNNGTATSDFTANGTIATLSFEVDENIPLGTYPIRISVVQGGTFNYNDEDVNFTTIAGSLIVSSDLTETILGDINGNGTPDSSDIKLIADHIASFLSSGLTENQIKIANIYTADDEPNGQPVINIKDLIALAQLIASM